MKKTILKPISNFDGNDGFIGYHFDDLESAQKKCTEFTNCAGVTYLPIYSQYEPRFGPPSQSDLQHRLQIVLDIFCDNCVEQRGGEYK